MEALVANSETELKTVASTIKDRFPDERLYLLYGNIGAGKTKFVQWFCRLLGVSDQISSPTFSLINEYDLNNEKIYHIDLYRLNTIDEALSIGIEDILYGESMCFLEWPQLIEPILPEMYQKLEFEIIGASSRKILIL